MRSSIAWRAKRPAWAPARPASTQRVSGSSRPRIRSCAIRRRRDWRSARPPELLIRFVFGAGIALVETALFTARPVPGFVMRPVEPRIELKSLLLRPRQAASSRVLEHFIAHLRATAA